MTFQVNPLTTAVISSLTITVLTACGAGNGGSTTNNQSDKLVTSPDKPTKISTKISTKIATKQSLVKAGTDEEFAEYYANASATPEVMTALPTAKNTAKDVAVNENDGSHTNHGSDGNKQLSSTNLIEQGVDELDYAKQTATHIFVTRMSEDSQPSVNVFAKPTTKPIANLPLPTQNFSGLFLNHDNLYALKQVNYGGNSWDKSRSSYDHGNIELDIISVRNPSTPNIQTTYSWQGNIQNSRRIGDSVYVVSNAQLDEPWSCLARPTIATDAVEDKVNTDFAPYPCHEPVKLTAEQIAERMPIDIMGNKVDPSQCYIPSRYNKGSQNLSNNITLITKVDVSGNNNHQTTCISASTEHLYMSKNALYLASWDYSYSDDDYQEHSIVHKFNLTTTNNTNRKADNNRLTQSVAYAGTGVVDGHINWESSSFAMNEHDGVLRVVTSQWDAKTGVKNLLHTLKESATKLELETIATLPNKQRPTRLGKPNERIKGIRFMGDEGYIVTFQQTDPLYKIDLSDPANPQILGGLEMPGYSAYLHRVTDKYLLGIGYAVDDNARPSAVQLTIFDTSADTPTIVDQDTAKAVDGDHHNFWLTLPVAKDSRTITTLGDENIMKVSIPYVVNEYNHGRSFSTRFSTRAIEYDIDLKTGKLGNHKQRNIYSPEGYYEGDRIRALMDGDDVYYSQFDGHLEKFVW